MINIPVPGWSLAILLVMIRRRGEETILGLEYSGITVFAKVQ